ncbi:hypothetical protein, partial [Salmonella enterica]|uniref:hypothetical protein n=1 Tax=Salmonella enterica TaxID=28901 RepID=UPI003D357E8D
ATTGTGLNVSGNATLTNATVSGTTETGTGAVVSGKLTADDTTTLVSSGNKCAGYSLEHRREESGRSCIMSKKAGWARPINASKH